MFIEHSATVIWAFFQELASVKARRYRRPPAPTVMFTLGNVDTDKTIEFVAKDPEQMRFCDTIDTDINKYNAEYFRNNPYHVFVGLRKMFLELKARGELPVDRDTLIYIKSLIPGEVHMNCTRHLGIDGSNVFDLTRAEIEDTCRYRTGGNPEEICARL